MDADRFGVSQLHQLRGRVGRGSAAGLCLLVTDARAGTPARARLDAVAATTDGFELARVDLESRREGDVLGATQSGRRSSLRRLRVLQHEDVIQRARAEATALVDEDPDLSDHPALAAADRGVRRRGAVGVPGQVLIRAASRSARASPPARGRVDDVGQVFDGIDDRLCEFLAAQPVFFVATRRTAAGTSTSRPRATPTPSPSSARARVAYLDLTGSGVETIAHLRENGRVTLMFCSFERAPRIVRLYGTGRVVAAGRRRTGTTCSGGSARTPGRARSSWWSSSRVADSCGYARAADAAGRGARRPGALARQAQGGDGLVTYRAERNAASIDGLAGLDASGG